MFMLCFAAFAGASIIAVLSVATGNLSLLLAMPLLASAFALLAGAALAIIAPHQDYSQEVHGAEDLDMDALADTLSQRLRSVSVNSIPAIGPDVVRNEKRSA
jgi:hypothetical protein